MKVCCVINLVRSGLTFSSFSEMFTRSNLDGEAEINNYLLGVADAFCADLIRSKEI